MVQPCPLALLVAFLVIVHGETGSLPGVWDFDIAGGCCAVVTSDGRMTASPMPYPSRNEGMHRVPSLCYSALFQSRHLCSPSLSRESCGTWPFQPMVTQVHLVYHCPHLLIPTIIHVYIDTDLRIAYTREMMYFLLGIQVNQRRAGV